MKLNSMKVEFKYFHTFCGSCLTFFQSGIVKTEKRECPKCSNKNNLVDLYSLDVAPDKIYYRSSEEKEFKKFERIED